MEKINYVLFKKKEYEKLKLLKSEYKQIQDDLKYYSEYDGSLIVKKNIQLQKQDDLRMELENQISQYKFQQSVTTEKIKKLAALRVEAKRQKKEYNLLIKWKFAFPSIKLNMINSVVPFIQNETNKNLSGILKGKRIIFRVEPTKTTNKLSIIIEDYKHNVKRLFDGWSGGQKDIMSLSIFLALNKLASLKSGKKLSFLILDEKFSSIDHEARNYIIELLKEQTDGRKIWVISHVENMDIYFDQVFKATLTDGISKLEKIK